ncbi:hypothetical protein PGN77_11345 [Klebsiella aerogenes]
MADITQLAQLRAELSNPAIGTNSQLRKVALSLVEALELKEEQRANWFQMAQKLGDGLDAAEKRVVKLPEVERPIDGTGYANAAGAQYYKERVIKSLTAQGFKVETE